MENVYVEGCEYYETDYTSLEGSVTSTWFSNFQLPVYRWLTQNILSDDMFEKYFGMLKGVNKLKFKYFNAYIEAKRLSGEMDTSLGNGLANLFLMMFFFCVIKGLHVEDFRAVVEGDDGLAPAGLS